MKPLRVFLLAIAIGLSSCKDERVPALEKRISDLEARTKAIEDNQKAKTDADAKNEARFKECIYSADDDFDTNLRNNGEKNGKGGYSVPTPILEQMQRQKQSRYEECKLLYK
jgi:hypothetical protein